MVEPKLAVIFDTNAYRNFVTDTASNSVLRKVKELKKLEALKNIQGYSSIAVAREMMAKLVEHQDGPNYKDCLNGIIAKAYHCMGNNGFNFIPPSEMLLTRIFFKTVDISQEEEELKKEVDLIRHFSLNKDEALEKHKENIGNINAWLEKGEEVFAKGIMELVEEVKNEIKMEYPKLKGKPFKRRVWERMKEDIFRTKLANGILYSISNSRGLQSSSVLSEDHKKLNTKYPLTVGFYSEICYEIVNKNINMQSGKSRERRWNWFSDRELAFLISDDTIGGRQVIIVTNDGPLSEIVSRYGYSNRVFTLEAYLKYLNT